VVSRYFPLSCSKYASFCSSKLLVDFLNEMPCCGCCKTIDESSNSAPAPSERQILRPLQSASPNDHLVRQPSSGSMAPVRRTDGRPQVPPTSLNRLKTVLKSTIGDRRKMQQPPGTTGAVPITRTLNAGTKYPSQSTLIGPAANPETVPLAGDAESSAPRAKTPQLSVSIYKLRSPRPPPTHTEGRPRGSSTGSTGSQTVSQATDKESSGLVRSMPKSASTPAVRVRALEMASLSPFAAASAGVPPIRTMAVEQGSSNLRVETRSRATSTRSTPNLSAYDAQLSSSPTLAGWLSIALQAEKQSAEVSTVQKRQAGARAQGRPSGTSQGQPLGADQRQFSGTRRRQRGGTSQLPSLPATADRPTRLHPLPSLSVRPFSTMPWTSPSGSEVRTINIGMETEFYLAIRSLHYPQETMSTFARVLAANYNTLVPRHYPRMRPNMRPYNLKGDYDRWCLVCDDTMSTPRSPCKSAPCWIFPRCGTHS
jgi:hypothetical protein